MKYLLQQMLAFWVIIVTVLIIVGVAFTQFTKDAVLDTTYEQMSNYADAIQLNSMDQPSQLVPNIQLTERALKNQRILFMVVDANETVQYPHSVQGSKPRFITEEDWQQLENGRGGSVRKTLEAPGLSGKDSVMSAMVLTPLFLSDGNKTVFYGAMAVLQPIEYMEKSIKDLTQNLFKAFLVSSVVALIVSYLLAKVQVKRINGMKRATKEIAEGNFAVEVKVKGNDELAELAQDFNTMANSLEESQKEIERQEERRRQFMADAAHEMRTPLTTINGLLEGLAYQAIPKNQEEKCISLMRNETTRLIRLVNENLDYEKIRTNQINLLIQEFDATDMANQIAEQLTPKAEEVGNEIKVLTTDKVSVTADFDRFVQVLVNIVQNAIQFTEDGLIQISLTQLTEGTEVLISDTGIGMTEDELKNIWERYYKADPSRKNTKHGESGLGLSIVQQIMKLHKGTVDVTSEKGKGTTFKLFFPKNEITEQIPTSAK
ncbi:HAMP domain-containing histidine kinase [Vagococcus coleopterorum]|uniref:histidine kinase n=1 Tax=Vagococcus coleopterorum TaxID=2714946 RepID=A0A6G8AMF9_9ENTE|nr:HAMP domain-containing sensor histidine kinase [Vagococcus coleopterorum]QIL46248.1 HAMP domain-containing histidine kinase [Vagococcus coleopterorum]